MDLLAVVVVPLEVFVVILSCGSWYLMNLIADAYSISTVGINIIIL